MLKEIKIVRQYYSCPSCGQKQVPADLELGITGSSSPALSRWASFLCAHLPAGQVEELLPALTGSSRLSASTIHRHTRSLGRRVLSYENRRALSQDWQLGDEDRVAAMVDGAMVLTREEGWREVKLGVISSDERRRYVGHLGAPGPLGRKLRRELGAVGAGRAGRQVALGDGARWVWKLFEDKFPTAVQVVDYYHVAQQIHGCASVLYGEGTAQGKAWAEGMKGSLWEQGPEAVLEKLRPRRWRKKGKRQAVENLRGYITRNRPRLDYPQFREQGLPVGSGQVESGCKQVVQRRLKGPGMRWSIKGAQEMLAVRCAALSDLWEEAWAKCA